jgi:hypothetical protein
MEELQITRAEALEIAKRVISEMAREAEKRNLHTPDTDELAKFVRKDMKSLQHAEYLLNSSLGTWFAHKEIFERA